MPENKRSDPEQALVDFREDLVNVLTDLQIEILALQRAVREPKPVSKERLQELRKKEKEDGRDRIHQQYSNKIRSATHLVR